MGEAGAADELPELHATCAGLKAWATVRGHAHIEECRKACGGQGFLRSSGIADLACLLSSVGVSIDRDGKGLPQLIAFYQLLDVNGDGFISQEDFCVAVLEAVIDPEHPEQGPRLPSGPPGARQASRRSC